ncbi:hypothetical protein I302_105859 [Kwoniella bestiolae CBS 10118]|uniref:F-box domain-containing protein n=1 Tax=Kwoniella bestiolae CBS 10118 TaxID=1296100 RepID=A0A1B9G2B7_9TREE|nr:hypothetical protein I302_04983 [Kwoniella bestiolae CBS 10118]OCF25172.1 hypothetical protein I302_04983 [Kwoniella bestiolae CBS 10118]
MATTTPDDHLVPTLTSLSGKVLPPEITLYVLSIFQRERSIQTLATMRRCSRDMYRTVNPFLYRHLQLSNRTSAFLMYPIFESYLKPPLPAESGTDNPSMVTAHSSAARHLETFKLVKTITINYGTVPEFRKPLNENIKRLFRKELLFPNVTSVCLIHHPSQMYLTPCTSVDLLLGGCRPQHVCVDRSFDRRLSYLDLTMKFYKTPKEMVIHGAAGQLLPNPSQVRVRMSYRKGPTEDDKPEMAERYRAEKAQQLLDTAYSSGYRTWRVVARKEEGYEPSKGIKDIQKKLVGGLGRLEKTYMKMPEGIDKRMIKNRLDEKRYLVNNLEWAISDREVVAEPPCAACAGEC